MSHPAKQFLLPHDAADNRLIFSFCLGANAPAHSLVFTGRRVLTALSDPQFDCYRLVLVSPSTQRVLVEETHCTLLLPQISIPRWTRAAQQIKAVIEARWKFKVVVIDFLRHGPGTYSIVIAEVINQGAALDCYPGHRWVALEEIASEEICDPERTVLQSLLVGGDPSGRPFFRLSWIEDVLDWISSAGAIDRSQLAGIEQLNASSSSALIRVDRKNAPALWFKAAGGPNASERRITTTLAALFPAYLPDVVASHNSWNAWVMEDAGHSLDDGGVIDLQALEQVALRVAELQIASVKHVHTLLWNGCCDQRLSVLREGVPALLPYLKEAMEMQNLHTAPKIGRARLNEVWGVFEDACLRLEAMDIPDTLIHSDINLGNILVGDKGSVFTDWTNAGVGNPFVTFEQLRAQLAQEKSTQAWVPRLTEIYQEAWKLVLPTCQIERAFTLVPLVSAASCLYSRRDWLTSEHRRSPQMQSYARSLARQMDRAAQAIELNQVMCV